MGEAIEEEIRKRAKELFDYRNNLYCGYVSGRDYQDKAESIRSEIFEKYGNLGMDIFNLAYKELTRFKEI